MRKRYCPVGQRLFAKASDDSRIIRRILREKNPNKDEVIERKENYFRSKKEYNKHANDCNLCSQY